MHGVGHAVDVHQLVRHDAGRFHQDGIKRDATFIVQPSFSHADAVQFACADSDGFQAFIPFFYFMRAPSFWRATPLDSAVTAVMRGCAGAVKGATSLLAISGTAWCPTRLWGGSVAGSRSVGSASQEGVAHRYFVSECVGACTMWRDLCVGMCARHARACRLPRVSRAGA